MDKSPPDGEILNYLFIFLFFSTPLFLLKQIAITLLCVSQNFTNSFEQQFFLYTSLKLSHLIIDTLYI